MKKSYLFGLITGAFVICLLGSILTLSMSSAASTTINYPILKPIIMAGPNNAVLPLGTLTIKIIGLPAGISSSITTVSYETYYYENHFNYTNGGNTPYYASYTASFTTTNGVTTVVIPNVIENYSAITISSSAIYGAQQSHGNQYLGCSASYTAKCGNYINPNVAQFNGTTTLKFWEYLNMTQWNATQANELIAMGVLANSPIIIGLIGNVKNTTTYGNIKKSGKYLAAGKETDYATYNTINNTLNFISTDIVPANATINESVDGASITAPGTYNINVKANADGFYYLNGSFNSSLIDGNLANWTYSISLSNGTVLIPNTTIQAGEISRSFSYRIEKSVVSTVVFDMQASANYTGFDPTVIVAVPQTGTGTSFWTNSTIDVGQTSYTNILLSNGIPPYTANWLWTAPNGNALTLSNTLISGLTPAVGTWISNTPITANVYSQSCNINNNYIYCIGGVGGTNTVKVAPITNNAIGTWTTNSPYPTSAIYQQSCNIYQGYIYCVGGIISSETNSVYVAPITNNTVGAWNANTPYPTAVALQSCDIYQGYIYCVGGYSSIPATINSVYTAPITNNAIGTWTANTPYPTPIRFQSCNILSNYIYCVGGNTGSGTVATVYTAPITNNAIGAWTASTAYPQTVREQSCNIYQGYIYCVGGNVGAATYSNAIYVAPIANGAIGNWFSATPYPLPLGLVFHSCNVYTGYLYCVGGESTVVYNSVYSSPLNNPFNNLALTLNTISSNSLALSFNGVIYYANALGSNNIYGTWAFNTTASDSAGNTIILTNTITINPALVASNAPIASNSVINNGQSSTLTIIAPTTGTSPYTYLWYSGTSATCTSDTSTGLTGLSNTFSPSSSTYYCVKETDSASTNSVVYTGTTQVIVNPALVSGLLTESNTIIDNSQYSLLTANPSGGTTPYVINWFALASCSGASVNTGTTYLVNPSLSTTYSYNVVDSAPTNSIVCSTSNTVTVHATPTVSAPMPSNNPVDLGQSVTFNTILTGIGSAFTVNLINNGFVVNSLTAQSAGTLTFGSNIPAMGFQTFNVMVTDLTPTTPFKFNSISNTITVSANALSANAITPINPTIDNGQSVTLTAGATGGTVPYTYQWYVTTCSGSVLATTQAYSASPSSTTTYCVKVTDGASATATATDVVTVNPALVSGLLTESNTIIDNSQYSLLTANPSGGTTPYVINWFALASCSGASVNTGTTYLVNPSLSTTYSYNVVDSAPTNSIVCSTSNTVTVHATPTVSAPMPSNNPVDLGQSVTFNTILTGIGSAFTVNLINNGFVVNSLTAQSAGTLTFGSNIPAMGFQTFNVMVTDLTPTTPFKFNSISNTITVSANALSANAITPINPTIDNGQSVTLTAGATGGTVPYTYQWYVTTCSGSVLATTQAYSASPSSTTTYCVKVTDGASATATATDVVTVNPALVAGAITPPAPTIDNGNSITLTSNPSGGTPSYTINWFAAASCAGGSVHTGTTYTPAPTSTTSYSYNVVDVASTPVSVCSATDTVTVNPQLTITLSPSSSTIVSGASVAFINTTSGGATPYTFAYTVNSMSGVTITGNSIQFNNIGVFNVIETVTDHAGMTANSANSVITVQAAVAPTYTSSSGFSIAYGQNTTFSATCTGSDTCNIIVAGKQVASSPTTVTYNFQSGLGLHDVGVYKIKFCNAIINTCTPDPFLTVYAPVYVQNATAKPAATFPNGLPSCANTLGGTCTGNDILVGTITLTNNLNVNGSIIIVPGSTLIPNGHSIITPFLFNSIGSTIIPSNSLYQNYSYSLAASGGAGDNQGFNTLVAGGIAPFGNGNPFTTPIFSPSNAILWYMNTGYLTGASGGHSGSNYRGGTGKIGFIIEANTLRLGTISAAANPGVNGDTSGLCTDPSGGGGGPIIVLIHGSGGYTPGTYNVLGGAGGLGKGGSCSSTPPAGNGGTGNVLLESYTTNAPIPFSIPEYYPLKLYTNVTANDLTYYLTQVFNSTLTTDQSNVAGLSYVPSPNQGAGIYQYNVTEVNSSSPSNIVVLLTVSTNMTDITSSLSCNTPIIQDLPNICSTTFSASPIDYSIKSDNLLNQHDTNTITGAIFSNANVTFTPQITLTYSFTSFMANILNNPLLVPITQNINYLHTARSGIYTREIINLTTYDESTFATLVANDILGFTGSINNYSVIYNSIIVNNANNIQIYMAHSNFQNPVLKITNETTTSTNVLYERAINNECPSSVSSGNYLNWTGYLIPIALGAQYQFNIYQGTVGYGGTGYYMLVYTPNPSSILTLVQSYLITGTPFGDYLLPNNQYKFVFYSPNCNSQLYATGLSIPINPISITIPTNNSVPTFPALNATFTCSMAYNSILANNIVSCQGNNPQLYVYKWQVIAYNRTSILGTNSILNATNITGSSFNNYHYLLANTSSYIYFCGYAYWGVNGEMLNGTSQQVGNCFVPNITHRVSPLEKSAGFLAIFLILTFVFMSKDPKVMGVLIVLGLFLGAATGVISNIPSPVFYGIAGVVLILAFLYERGG